MNERIRSVKKDVKQPKEVQIPFPSPADDLHPAFGSTHGSDAVKPEIADFRPVGQLIQYWCAVAVAEELHFTRAAHRLHIDQSALSRHIQKLESSLGVRLFIRGDRRIELTEAGEVLIPYAKKALLAARAGVRIAQAVSRGEPQEFEVAYSTSVDTHLIAGIRNLIEKARARIPVRFRSYRWDQVVRRLLDGESHAAITLLPVEEAVASACILREEMFLVVPEDHVLSRCSEVAVGEIDDEGVIWPTGVMPRLVTKGLFERFRKAGYVPNVTHEGQTIAESLGLAREGLGITFLKTSDRALVGDGLKVVPLTAPVIVETGLLHIRERRWDFLEEFVALVRNHFRCERQAEQTQSGSPSTEA
jgi:DNA-binding transcriptional LysR family regulator